ncbi:hypothetical protein [Enterococcus faecium]|uniref:hypothetical protein n=1 Tax=Enterococcus faecium TaxID=1352 RepID=UPI00241526FC|nr:hypothetical protein [Enterococcus faecium]EKG8970822.1 hypothetical protein [Enterococcus faecalis]EJC3740895.1 hypothetical protein [Enterococcus faecium]EKY8177291.1 hypothetical protein [Enterococcus faecium]MDG4568901.1 hypothetical protein [Enterococcus faecium]MDG4574318.1 hypothetical protein [Enterococcus faecium]
MVRKVLLSMDSKNIDAYRRYRFANQMRLNGSTLADIAVTLRVSVDTVRRALKQDPDCCFIKVNTGRSRRLAKRYNSLIN